MCRALALLSAAIFPTLLLAAPPDTQPTAKEQASILILPFAAPAGAADAWIGAAVQQDLLTELTQGTRVRVAAPSGAVAIDAKSAVQAAHDSGAAIVVFGQAQTAGSDLRLTGQVLAVATGSPLGALKVTGPSSDLFHMEDALAVQVFSALPRSLLKPEVQRAIDQQAADAQRAASAPDEAAVTHADAGVAQEIAPPPVVTSPQPYVQPVQPVQPPYAYYPSYGSDASNSYPPAYAYGGCIQPSFGSFYSPFAFSPFCNSGGFVVVSNLPLPHRDFPHHHEGGHGRSQNGAMAGPGGRGASAVSAPSGMPPTVGSTAGSNPVSLRFTWGQGDAPFRGPSATGGFRPAPRVNTGFTNSGFSSAGSFRPSLGNRPALGSRGGLGMRGGMNGGGRR